MASRKKAFKTIAIGQSFVRLLQIGNNLLLIPLYLKVIGAEQYGYWLATGGILAWVSACDFGLVGIVKQRCALFLGKKETARAIQYFHAGLLVYGGIILVMLALIWGLSLLLQPILSLPAEDADLYRYTFCVAGIAMGFSLLGNVFAGYLHASQRPGGDILAAAIGQLLNLAVVIYLLLFTTAGLWAIPLGLLTNHACYALFLILYFLFKTSALSIRPVFEKSIFRDYFTTGPVLFLSRLGSQLTSKIEPTLIVIFLTPELATMYTVVKRLVEVLFGFANSVRGGMLAGFSHFYGEQGAAATSVLLDRILQITIGISLLVVIFYISVNQSFVSLWVGEAFYLGSLLSVFIAFEAFTNSIANTTIQLVGALGEMRRSSLALLAESILKVFGMLILLPLIGVVGLPIAGLLSASGKLYYSLRRLHEHLQQLRLRVLRPGWAVLLATLLFAAVIGLDASGFMQSGWIWALALPMLFLLLSGLYLLWAFPYLREEFLALCLKVRSAVESKLGKDAPAS